MIYYSEIILRKNFWIEIDRKVIKNNINIISKISDGSEIMAIVKANAYGHDILQMTDTLINLGINSFGVSNISEAICLRNHFKNIDIYCITYIPREELKLVLEKNIIISISSISYLDYLIDLSKSLDISPKITIALDTGMKRLGFKPNYENAKKISEILTLNNLSIYSVFSHFSDAYYNYEFSKFQNDLFKNFKSYLEELGTSVKKYHIANSVATLAYSRGMIEYMNPLKNIQTISKNTPTFQYYTKLLNEKLDINYDMIRIGDLIYGISEIEGVDFKLRPALSIKGNITHINYVKKGESIGYSRNYFAKNDMKIAILPFGYYDGFSKSFSKNLNVLINGKKCSLVGNITMNLAFCDITDLDANEGDEFIILGEQKNNKISFEDLQLETSIGEFLTQLNLTIPRIYIN